MWIHVARSLPIKKANASVGDATLNIINAMSLPYVYECDKL